MKEKKVKGGGRWGSKWTRGKRGAPAPHVTQRSTNGKWLLFVFICSYMLVSRVPTVLLTKNSRTSRTTKRFSRTLP